jgi:hypothetical protein
MRDAQALVAAHITTKIEAWRSAQPSLRPVSVPPPVPFSALHLRSHPVVRHVSVVRQVRWTPSAPNTGFVAHRCNNATVDRLHCCTTVQPCDGQNATATLFGLGDL